MIELRLLGATALRADDGRDMLSILAQPKRVALLAYLAAARPHGFHRRDTLVALLWPDLDQARARQALNKSVHHLRRSLGDGVIISRGDEEIALDDSLTWNDVRAFDTAVAAGERTAALDHYQGDLAAGLYVDEAPEFEQWLSMERDRLRGAAARVAGELADGTADAPAAIALARRAIELAPYDEHAVRRLMRLLDRTSEPANAAFVYDEFARRLERDLNLAPSIEAQRLRESLGKREAHSTAAGPPPEQVPVVVVAGIAQAARVPQEVKLPASAVENAPALPDQAAADSRPQPSGRSAKALALLALSGIAAVVVFLIAGRNPRAATSNATPFDRILVAVPENRTGDSTLDVLGPMASDWMAQGLINADLGNVVEPGEAMQIARSQKNIVDRKAEEDGPGLTITGAYYKLGDSLRFQLQLTNTANPSGNRAFQDVTVSSADPGRALELLREQALSLVALARAPELSGLLRGSPHPPRYAAYREYIEGVDLYARRRERDAYQHFARAAELDTSFSLAMLNAAMSMAPLQPAITDSIISRLSEQREQLSPVSRAWLDVMKAIQVGDLEEHSRLLRPLANDAPRSFFPYQYAQSLIILGRVREAADVLRRIDTRRGWMKGWYSYWVSLAMVDHMLHDSVSELADLRTGSAEHPRNIALATGFARYHAAHGNRKQLDSLLDDVTTMQAQPNWDAGSVFAVAALEASAHGHEDWVESIRSRTLRWYKGLPISDRNQERNSYGLSWVLYSVGALDELDARLTQLRRESRCADRCIAMQGLLSARRGDREGARRIDEQLRARIDASGQTIRLGALLYARAQIAAWLGDRNAAIELIRQALARGLTQSVYMHTELAFAAMRNDATYSQLIEPR